MTIALCLLLYSLVVAVLGPRLLVRLTRAGVAPRLGIAVWLMAIVSVVGSWVAATVALAVELLRGWKHPGTVLSACVTSLRGVVIGESGIALQLGLFTLAVLAIASVTTLGWRWGRSLLRARSQTHKHASLARVAGRRVPGLDDVVVLDAPERIAYCAAGRPNAIVVSSAALDALDGNHLSAVLAHERAHLAGRHHLLLAATRGLAAILPRIELVTLGAKNTAELLEMCADDAAARGHGAGTVLGALLTLSGVAPIPAGALGAASVGVLARAERLAEPAGPARQLRLRLLLSGIMLILATGPVLTALLAARDAASCLP